MAWSRNRKPDPVTGKVPAVGSTVNIKNASYTNTIGAAELKKLWKDPAFEPQLHAFYCARVLQIPTPRWTAYDAKRLGGDCYDNHSSSNPHCALLTENSSAIPERRHQL